MASLSEEILSNSDNKENRSLEEMPLVSALQEYLKCNVLGQNLRQDNAQK